MVVPVLSIAATMSTVVFTYLSKVQVSSYNPAMLRIVWLISNVFAIRIYPDRRGGKTLEGRGQRAVSGEWSSRESRAEGRP